MSEIHPRLVAALQELFGIPPSDLTPEAELEDDLQLDSLAIVELQVVLEEAFEVRITTEDPSGLRTLADLQRELDAALERAEPAMPVLELSEDGA